MKHTGLLATGLLLTTLGGSLQAQDEVTYQDPATRKQVRAIGAIQRETPVQIVLRITGSPPREVPATAVIDVLYELPAQLRAEYTRLRGEVSAEELIKGYTKLIADLTDEKYRYARRHLQFLLARAWVRRADEEPAQHDAAIAALAAFQKEHADSWQIHNCLRLLAHLQLEKKDFSAAQQTYAAWLALPGLPSEARQECELLVARAWARAGKLDEARRRLLELARLAPADDPQAFRAKVYLAECSSMAKHLDEAVKELEALIGQTTDPELKGLAYCVLGDCYLAHGKIRDALWPYLWVDVVYYQDRRQQARAVEQLAKIFADLGDATRARQYSDKLRRDFR